VKAMSPYSLPCDHPAARFLETLLPCSRVIDSEAAFLAAGVEIRKKQDRSPLAHCDPSDAGQIRLQDISRRRA